MGFVSGKVHCELDWDWRHTFPAPAGPRTRQPTLDILCIRQAGLYWRLGQRWDWTRLELKRETETTFNYKQKSNLKFWDWWLCNRESVLFTVCGKTTGNECEPEAQTTERIFCYCFASSVHNWKGCWSQDPRLYTSLCWTPRRQLLDAIKKYGT
jgi:hypothetical protein